MNKTFRVQFNRCRNTAVVTSEIGNKIRGVSRKAAVIGAVVLGLGASGSAEAYFCPSGGTYDSATATCTFEGQKLSSSALSWSISEGNLIIKGGTESKAHAVVYAAYGSGKTGSIKSSSKGEIQIVGGSGSESYGISVVAGNGSSGTIENSSTGTLSITGGAGSNSYGITYVGYSNGTGTILNSGSGKLIIQSGSESGTVGIYAVARSGTGKIINSLSGTLSITGSSKSYSYGIYKLAYDSGTATIENSSSGALSITSGSGAYSCGISTIALDGGTATIENSSSGTLSITGGVGTYTYGIDYVASGSGSTGKIINSSTGTLSITGGSKSYSYGIYDLAYDSGTATIENSLGGTLVIKGNSSAKSYGIYRLSSSSSSSGTIDNAGLLQMNAYAINAPGNKGKIINRSTGRVETESAQFFNLKTTTSTKSIGAVIVIADRLSYSGKATTISNKGYYLNSIWTSNSETLTWEDGGTLTFTDIAPNSAASKSITSAFQTKYGTGTTLKFTGTYAGEDIGTTTTTTDFSAYTLLGGEYTSDNTVTIQSKNRVINDAWDLQRGSLKVLAESANGLAAVATAGNTASLQNSGSDALSFIGSAYSAAKTLATGEGSSARLVNGSAQNTQAFMRLEGSKSNGTYGIETLAAEGGSAAVVNYGTLELAENAIGKFTDGTGTAKIENHGTLTSEGTLSVRGSITNSEAASFKAETVSLADGSVITNQGTMSVQSLTKEGTGEGAEVRNSGTLIAPEISVSVKNSGTVIAETISTDEPLVVSGTLVAGSLVTYGSVKRARNATIVQGSAAKNDYFLEHLEEAKLFVEAGGTVSQAVLDAISESESAESGIAAASLEDEDEADEAETTETASTARKARARTVAATAVSESEDAEDSADEQNLTEEKKEEAADPEKEDTKETESKESTDEKAADDADDEKDGKDAEESAPDPVPDPEPEKKTPERVLSREASLASDVYGLASRRAALYEDKAVFGKSGLWLSPDKEKSRFGAYKSDRFGFTVGARHAFNEGRTALGLAAFYSKGKLKGFARDNVEGFGAVLFSAQRFGAGFVAGTASVSRDKTRKQKGTGLNRLSATAASVSAKAGLALGNQYVTVTPYAGVRGIYLKTSRADSAQSAQVTAGAKVLTRIRVGDWKFQPEADVSYARQMKDRELTLKYDDGNTSVFAGNNAVQANIAASVTRKNVTATLRYTGAAGDKNYRSHAIGLDISYKF